MTRGAEEAGRATVVRAAERSLAELADLHTAGFTGYALPVHSDAAALADRARREHIDLWLSFLLSAGDAPAALTLVARRGRRSRIASMSVPPAFRRRGWGRRALAVACSEGRERGDSLQLEVLTSNLGAVALYEAAGFRPLRRLVGFAGPLAPLRRAGELAPLDLATAADRVAATGADLSWQLAPATLHGLGGECFAVTNGPAVAVARVAAGELALYALATVAGQRRRGHAGALLRALAHAHPEAERVVVSSIVPEGLADACLLRLGLARAPLEQLEMHLVPPRG